MAELHAITLDGGELRRFEAEFTPHLILTHLKVAVVISDRRVIVRRPQTIFGLIPVGYYEQSSPLVYVSEVAAGESFSSRRLGYGVIALLVSLMSLASGTLSVAGAGSPVSLLIGFVMLGVAAYMFLSAHTIGIHFRNHGGGLLFAHASRSERAQVESAKTSITRLLFNATTAPLPSARPTPAGPATAGARPSGYSDAALASDPNTSGAVLSQIAERSPSLRPIVAANPSTYRGLLEWLAALNDPAVDEAIANRPA